MKPARGSITAFSFIAVLAFGCATTRPFPTATTRVAAAVPQAQLIVALYPYVPRVDQFQAAITAAWKKVQPNVPIYFVGPGCWDGGYDSDPPPYADVYVFDAMFFDYFRSKNWLEPMQPNEVAGADDFVPYAKDAVQVSNVYYAIPQLGCANVLFYQGSDVALKNATTLADVHKALSECTYTSQIPVDRRGLMVDMAGGSTNAALYLDVEHGITGQYPLPLPTPPAQLDPKAVAGMRELVAMSSYENATAKLDDQPYQRGKWFGAGYGRALIGFTEDMSAMTDTTRENIGFKVLPPSNPSNPPLFFTDVIGVNPATNQRGTRALAVQLANVMAAADTMVASIGPDAGNSRPQYLMATRPSVFGRLGKSFPTYNRMYDLITKNRPVAFKLSAQSRPWINATKSTIRQSARQGYPCGCAFPAYQVINGNPEAPTICQGTCAMHGGWNGQWTNQQPAAPAGVSVCGCKTCLIQ